jgi:hypothetical protein
LWRDDNKNLLELLNKRRTNTTIAAETLIEDAIINGDKRMALDWLKFLEIRENGTKLNVNVSGSIKLEIQTDNDKHKKDIEEL